MKSLFLLAALLPLLAGDGARDLHAPLTALLSAHVARGQVDYAGLKDDETQLDAYLADLAAVDPGALDPADAKAFWIDAYNAFTLKLMLEHWPGIESIKDIPAARRWKAKRWAVHGRRVSLDQIEHEILRPMGDARIHFAIVCASRSCPDLAGEAYRGETLDAQLDAAARRFLADRSKGLFFGDEAGWLYGTNHVLRLSSILDWFEEDFETSAGSVLAFVKKYAPADALAYMAAHSEDLDVEHFAYDWSLNGRPATTP